MTRSEIETKLIAQIERGWVDEPQVIFILTRIRKIFDGWTDVSKIDCSSYEYLYLFCNWAVHNRINGHQAVIADIKEKLKSEQSGNFVFFNFFDELKEFIKNYISDRTFATLENDQYNNFKQLVIGLFSNVPLIIKDSGKIVFDGEVFNIT